MENQETQPQDKTSKIYGGIEDALEVETSLVSDITKDKSSDLAEPVESTPIQKQILKDYEYSRGQFYSLIEKPIDYHQNSNKLLHYLHQKLPASAI